MGWRKSNEYIFRDSEISAQKTVTELKGAEN